MADEHDTLQADQAHRLVRPITETAFDPMETAVAQDLATPLHTFPLRLRDVLEETNDRFPSEKRTRTYVKVVLPPCGRELTREIDALLHEIEDRLRPLLKEGKRARLT